MIPTILVGHDLHGSLVVVLTWVPGKRLADRMNTVAIFIQPFPWIGHSSPLA